MATEVVHSIRASGNGGDYTSLSAWESAQQRNLVAADEIEIAECYNDWPTGLNDILEVDSASWTTDSTRKIIIRAASGQSHDGTPNTGFWMYADNGDFGNIFSILVGYTELYNLDVVATHALGYAYSIVPAAGNCWVENCIGKSGDTTFKSYLNPSTFVNCLSYGTGTQTVTAAGYRHGDGIAAEYYNCVAYDCEAGWYGGNDGDASGVIKNCVAYKCRYYNFYVSGGASGSGANASDAYSYGNGDYIPNVSNDYYSALVDADFADVANEDFHLVSGSNIRGTGYDLSSIFTTDIDGDPRPSGSGWDRGIDQWIAPAPTLSSPTSSNVADTTATVGCTVTWAT